MHYSCEGNHRSGIAQDMYYTLCGISIFTVPFIFWTATVKGYDHFLIHSGYRNEKAYNGVIINDRE